MQIVYYVAASLDGYIADRDGGVAWLNSFDGDGDDMGFTDFYGDIEGIVMGRKTYEFALAHPPWLAPGKPTWVMTSRVLPLADPQVTLTAAPVAELMRQMTDAGLKRVWMMGGGQAASAFLAAGCIHELWLHVIPLCLGSGIPLFTEVQKEVRMTLRDHHCYANGIAQLRYDL